MNNSFFRPLIVLALVLGLGSAHAQNVKTKGPAKVATPNKPQILDFENDDIVNPILNNVKNNVRCRFYGIDMGKFAKWKHSACSDLYDGHIHWLGEKKIFIDK